MISTVLNTPLFADDHVFLSDSNDIQGAVYTSHLTTKY